MHRHPRRGAARGARPAPRSTPAARRPGPAGGRDGGGRELERRRDARRHPPGVALPRSRPGAVAQAPVDARRRVLDPARPALRVPAPRCRQRRAAGPARRPSHRDDLGRRHSRQRRLRRRARAARDVPRIDQRGFRDREPPRRHLPARQHVVAHPARGAQLGAGRGRARPAAEPPVLARRGARAHRRGLRRRLRPARLARATVRGGRGPGRHPRGPRPVRARAR